MSSSYRREPAAWVAILTLTAVLCASPAVLGAGCVATTLQVPAGHPARADAASVPHERPAAILEPDAPLYTPDAGDEAGATEHHREHAAPPAQSGDEQPHEHDRGQP